MRSGSTTTGQAAQDGAGGLRGAGVRQVPVLRPVLHVDGVAGLGLHGHDDPLFRSPSVPFGCSVRSAAAADSTYYRKS